MWVYNNNSRSFYRRQYSKTCHQVDECQRNVATEELVATLRSLDKPWSSHEIFLFLTRVLLEPSHEPFAYNRSEQSHLCLLFLLSAQHHAFLILSLLSTGRQQPCCLYRKQFRCHYKQVLPPLPVRQTDLFPLGVHSSMFTVYSDVDTIIHFTKLICWSYFVLSRKQLSFFFFSIKSYG